MRVYLDVIIVNWNAGTQLQDCLRSLETASQDYNIFRISQCFVVDNASTDNSAEHIEKHKFPISLIKNRENKGFSYASNQGAKAGNAEFILFLNPDVMLFQDSLVKPLLFMSKSENERVGIMGIQLIDQEGAIQRNVARFPTPKSLFYQMLGLDHIWPKHFPSHFMTDWDHRESRDVDQIQGSFFLVRREAFDALQGFDERFFMYFEDLDFSFRAKQAGWKSYYLATVQAYHRGGGTSYQVKARRLFYVLSSKVKYVAKHFGFKSALAILFATLGFESITRIIRNLISFSGRSTVETIQAYSMFLKEVPHLLNGLRNE